MPKGARFSAENMASVAALLRRRWSAEQISGILKKTGELSISVETIYRRIRWDKEAGGSLWRHTRIMSKFGRKRYGRQDSRGVLPGKRHITERPSEVEGRQRVGHWEGDTVMGSDMRHCVLTLVERKSGFAIIKKLKARTKDEVTRAATRAIRKHCRRFKTITFDNGTEFHDYRLLEERFPVKVYFATVGVGTTMLLHCDFVVLAEDALLSMPFVNLALVPEAASSLLLPARIGHSRAFEMFALGKAITEAQALDWGIGNRMVPIGELHGEANQIASQLAKQAAGSL